MSTYNYSYNVLINRFEAFAAGHLLIKRFTHGQIDLSDQLNDDQYPFMHVTPDTIEPTKGAMQFGFHIMFADIPRDKETKAEYQREVISDCVRLGQDLIAEITNGLVLFGFNVQMIGDVVFEPFMEEQKNTVTGVAFTIKLEVPWDWSACDIPAVWAVGGESTGGSGSPIGLLLQVNNVNNVVQSELDLVAGTNITLTDNGDGSVTIDSTGGGGGGSGTVTSVALTAPAAFNVSGSPVTTSGTLALSAAGNASQYITGAGALQTFPTIPAAQVNSDWNAVSGVAQILNKPTIPAAQVNSDWNAVSGVAQILNKPTLAAVATSGDYNDLINQPTIPTNLDDLADVNAPTPSNGQVLTYNSTSGDWEASTPSTGGGILHGTAAGTDTFTVTITGATPYADGDAYLIRFTNGNTTACTLNINGLGAVPLYRNNDGALIGGDIWAGAEMLCIYNSTTPSFQCIGTSSNSLFAYVTNAEASTTMTKGQPVYAFGGTGDRLTVKLAYNPSDTTSAQTVGMVVSTSIAPNQKGIIIVAGQLDNLSTLPTSTFADGDAIYLGATAGSITNVKPSAPNHLVYLGIVTTASAGNAGRMYVRVQNGYELQELHNVVATAPANNDYLYYDSSTSLYRLRQLTASLITDSTTVGQNLIKLPNPSAVRYLRINADNTVSALSLASLKSDLGFNTAVLGADITNATLTGYEDVTGLSFAVTAGKTYKWRATLGYTNSANIQLSINGPAVTFNRYRFTSAATSTGNLVSNQTTYNNPNSTTAAVSGVSTADGIIKPSANGTVIVRYRCASIGGLTVLAGSIIEWEEVL